MNNEERYIRNRKRAIVIGAIAFLILAVLSIILAYFDSRREKVFISGLDDCMIDLRSEDREKVYKIVFEYAKEQNAQNGKENKSSYNASVRADSCHNEKVTIDGQEHYSANMIVDIADLQYSYRVKYSYIPTNLKKNEKSYADLGTVMLYCLDEKDMIYPDFNCTKSQLATPEPDPITMVSGYVYEGCTLTYTTSGTSKSGYAIILTYKPSESTYLNGGYMEFKAKCHDDAMEYLENAGINKDDYYFYERG